MDKVPLCTPAWWEDPMVLISDSWLAQWKRRSTPHVPCFSERVNALTRTGIAVLLVALLFSLFNHNSLHALNQMNLLNFHGRHLQLAGQMIHMMMGR